MNLIAVKTALFLSCAIALQTSLAQTEEIDGSSSEHAMVRSSVFYDLIKPVPAKPFWYVQTSVYTKHFRPKSEHNNNQELIGLERHTENSYLMGGATFYTLIISVLIMAMWVSAMILTAHRFTANSQLA